MTVEQFYVTGTPVPQGSKTSFRHSKTGAVVMVDANPALKAWRATVDATARREWSGRPALDGGVTASLLFYMPRPKGHYGTGRNAGILKPSAPTLMTVKPDVDKLSRAVLDSLSTAGIWTDDCRAWGLAAWKHYADGRPAGVLVTLEWGTLDD
jgi:Holliday junction resolvase RusA-like endonuclease